MSSGSVGRAAIQNAAAHIGKFRNRPSLLAPIALCFTILLQIGCAHYDLGRPGALPFGSLYIAPVSSDTLVAQVQALLSRNLVEAFIRDGSVMVTGQQEAEATLRVVLIGHERIVSVTRADDTALGRSFELILKVEVTLLDNSSGKIYFSKRTFEASEQVFDEISLPESEYQAMPTLVRDLANRIKNGVVNIW